MNNKFVYLAYITNICLFGVNAMLAPVDTLVIISGYMAVITGGMLVIYYLEKNNKGEQNEKC